MITDRELTEVEVDLPLFQMSAGLYLKEFRVANLELGRVEDGLFHRVPEMHDLVLEEPSNLVITKRQYASIWNGLLLIESRVLLL